MPLGWFHGKTVANCGLTQQQYCCLANTLALSFFVTGILLRIILICGTFCILITPVCSMRVERVEPLGFFVALSFFVTGICEVPLSYLTTCRVLCSVLSIVDRTGK